MSSQFRTESFKELQKEWYNKLKQEGFLDIECQFTGKLLGDAACPKPINSKLKDEGAGTRIQRYFALEPYYRQARLFLHSHPFQSPLEKTIWRLHAEECLGRQRIVAKLKVSEHLVKKVLKNLKDKMKDFHPDLDEE